MSIVGSVGVRVVPSFSGMQKTIGRQFSSAGADAGKTFSSSLGAAVDLRSIGGAVEDVGQKISGVGGQLTKGITLPVAGAAAAVGGLVGALGFRRLVGLDTAQAKLRGLGYDAESVERISGQVADAIEGTMITMAEGVNIAAGAMAVGVEEGEELEKYIRLVGDAATASGRPIDEMAMIFNRVEGSGKLMTQELNMLEQAVPGVTQTLADSYGVSFDAFREMVTNGEVDAAHFRSVMDEFMGGMGEEYANSFEGMTKNVLAYIGILGENLLSGAFPQMKEALADFIDFLASDDVAAWAQGVGESIGSAFSSAIEWVRSAIDWWTNLDSSTQKLIGWIVGIAVALGPVLVAIGTTITIVGKLIGTLAFLANPITWIIAGIAALVAGLTWFFTQTEIGQKIISTAWDWIQRAISFVVDWFTNTAIPAMVTAWEWLSSAFTRIWNGVIKPVWDAISAVISWVWNSIIQPIFGFIVAAFQALGAAFSWVWNNVIKPMWDMFVAAINWVWTSIVQPIFNMIVAAFRGLGQGFMNTWNNVIKPVFDFIAAIITWVWINIAQPYFQNMGGAFQAMGDWLSRVWSNVIRPMIQRFGDWIVNLYQDYVQPALGWISDRWDWLSGGISTAWDTIRGYLRAFGNFVRTNLVDRISDGVDRIKSVWDAVAGFFREPINWVINTVWNDGLRAAYNAVAGLIPGVSTLDRVGGLGSVPAFAKGGVMDDGWKLVGEEGPELIRTGPGWVATANETQRLLNGGSYPPLTVQEFDLMMGRTAPSDAPIGGEKKGISGSGQTTGFWGSLGNAVQERIDSVVDLVRGGLADGFRSLVKPITDKVSGMASGQGRIGQMAGGFIDWGVDEIADWIAGKDAEQFAADGSYDGAFTANPGGFNRPAAGGISSWAGRRGYSGRFGNMHFGVDIMGPIGAAVRAAYDGVVKRVYGSGLDKRMVLNHGGFDTSYLHNSAHLVGVGQTVTGGQQIAKMGTAGTGPHLHFELHPGGWYNPSIGGVNALFRDKGGLLYPGMNQVLNETGSAEYVFNQRQFENLNRMAEGRGNHPMIGEMSFNGALPSEFERGMKRAVFREMIRQGVPVAVPQ